MKPVRAVFLALLTLSGMVAGVSLAAGVTTSSATTSAGTERVGSADLEADATNASLGTRISAFMQSSAAQADGAVDAGMWTATYDNTSNESEKSRLIDGHTEALRDRLEDIRQRKQELIERREAGEISRLKYESEMGSLVGRYVSLNEAINETSTRAESAGANTTELADLREESKDVAGPEVAEAARNLSGVDAPGLDRAANRSNGSAAGPGTVGPGDRGNGTERAKTDARNTTRSAGGPGNRTADAGSARANQAENASANADASVGANATLTATGNATVPTQAAATAGGNASGRSNATANGPPDDRGEGSNARSNASNRSDADRKPATEGPTRTVTSPDTSTETAAAESTTGSTATPDATAVANETEAGANATAGAGGTTEFTTAG